MRSSIRLRVVDVAAIMTVTGVVASLVGAAAVSKAEVAGRIKCASNLKQIGVAMMLYANENRGAYPRTGAGRDPVPTWGTPYSPEKKELGPTPKADPYTPGPETGKSDPVALAVQPAPNDVTAALYRLIPTQDIAATAFVCPSTTLKPFDFGGAGHEAREWTNFPGKEGVAAHLSYSYQNPYASAQAIGAGFHFNNSLWAEFVLAADMNPGTDALLTATIEGAPKPGPDVELTADQKKLNSLNHGGAGQNVLFADGHVAFMTTPFTGRDQDNIYVSGDTSPRRKGTKPAFAASPVDASDSILLPTAADIGQVVVMRDTLPPVDPTALLTKIRGEYHLDLQDRTIKLTVGDKTLKIKAGPTTTDLTFEAADASEDAVAVIVSGEEVPSFTVTMKPHAGGLKIEGDSPLTADWKSGPSTRPASRPAGGPASRPMR